MHTYKDTYMHVYIYTYKLENCYLFPQFCPLAYCSIHTFMHTYIHT